MNIFNNVVYAENAVNVYYMGNGNVNFQYNTGVCGNCESVFYFRFSADNYIVKNNNFVNFGDGYLCRSFDTHDPTNEISEFDYNNCYTNGTYFARWVGEEYSLSEFQDSTSFLTHISQTPSTFYVSNGEFYTFNGPNFSGIYNSMVTDDINGNERDTTSPTVGAIEFSDTTFNFLLYNWDTKCGADTNHLFVTKFDDENISSYNWVYNGDTSVTDEGEIYMYMDTSSWLKVVAQINSGLFADSAFMEIDVVPEINLVDDTTLCTNQVLNISLDTSYTYIWSTGEVSNEISIDSTDGSGIYYVTIVNGACVTQDSMIVNFDTCNTNEEVEGRFNLSVFPVPAKQYLTVSSTNPIKYICIYTSTGQLIKEYRIYRKGNILLPVSDLNRGFYTLSATMETGEVKRIKFVKE